MREKMVKVCIFHFSQILSIIDQIVAKIISKSKLTHIVYAS